MYYIHMYSFRIDFNTIFMLVGIKQLILHDPSHPISTQCMREILTGISKSKQDKTKLQNKGSVKIPVYPWIVFKCFTLIIWLWGTNDRADLNCSVNTAFWLVVWHSLWPGGIGTTIFNDSTFFPACLLIPRWTRLQ